MLGGLACLGVISAHIVAYLAVSPDPHQRALLLEATGHDYWALVVALATGVLVAGLAQWIGAIRDGAEPVTSRRLYASSIPRLAALQVFGFLTLESFERAGTVEGLTGLLFEPAVIVGIALQLAFALLAAALLVVITRVAEALIGPTMSLIPARSLRLSRPLARITPPRFGVATGGATPRGPPLTS